MPINKDELGRLAARYQVKADRAYMNYQETGISRYDRERRNNEDMAEALRMAISAADDHMVLGHLRAEFVWLASEADKALAENDSRDKLAGILESLVSAASIYCKYKRRDRPSEEGGA